MASPFELPPRYRILAELGSGSWGTVYKAFDRVLEAEVALKIGPPNDSEFENELRALARVDHPAVASLLDAGRIGERPYYTMEMVEGPDLRALRGLLPRKRGAFAWLVLLLESLLEGLESIHREGLVHGDISPSNILWLAPGSWDRRAFPDTSVDPLPIVKIADFGFAGRADHSRRPPGEIRGTPAYLAPEVVKRAPPDVRSDLFSTGAVAYEILCGRAPYPDLKSLAAAGAGADPPPVRSLRPEVPEGLASWVDDLVRRDPRRRPADAEEARRRLRAWAWAAGPLPGPVPLLGRDRELKELLARFSDLGKGRSTAAIVAGEPGSGRTRLLLRAARAARADLGSSLYVFPLCFSRGEAFEVFEALCADLRALSPGRPTDVESPKARLESHVLDTLNRAARKRPVALLIDDLEHVSAPALGLLAALVDLASRVPLGLFATAGPAFLRRRRSRSGPLKVLCGIEERFPKSTIRLAPFGEAEIREFLERSLRPRRSAPDELVAALLAETRGNPAAVRKTLSRWCGEGRILQAQTVWSYAPCTAPATPPPPPATEDPAGLEVLTAVALAAASATPQWLRAACSSPPGAVEAAVRRLVGDGYLEEDSGSIRLGAGLDRDRVLAWAGKHRLRRLARRAADAFSKSHDPDSPSDLLQLGTLERLAGRERTAYRRLLAAGRRAAAAFSHGLAAEAFRGALSCARSPAERAECLRELAELHLLAGEIDEAVAIFESLDREAALGGIEREDLVALWDRLGSALERRGELDRAEEYFERCRSLSAHDSRRLAKALFRLGQVQFERGDLARARALLEESLKHYGRSAPPSEIAAVSSSLGLVERRAGRLSEAVVRFERALEAARKAGNPLLEATILNNLGNLHRARAAIDDALACLERSLRVRERAGDRQGLAITLNNLARVRFQRGELAAAAEATRRALELFGEVGDRKGLAIARTNLGEIEILRGRFHEALELLEANLAEESTPPGLVASTRINLARIAIECADWHRALNELRCSLEVLPDEGAAVVRAGALLRACEAYLALGHREEAEDALLEAEEFSSGEQEMLCDLRTMRLRLLLAAGEPEAAVELGSALVGNPPPGLHSHELARLERELAKAYRELGPDWADRTERHFEHALREFERMESPHEQAATLVELALYWRLLEEIEEADKCERAAADLFRAVGLERRAELAREPGGPS